MILDSPESAALHTREGAGQERQQDANALSQALGGFSIQTIQGFIENIYMGLFFGGYSLRPQGLGCSIIPLGSGFSTFLLEFA